MSIFLIKAVQCAVEHARPIVKGVVSESPRVKEAVSSIKSLATDVFERSSAAARELIGAKAVPPKIDLVEFARTESHFMSHVRALPATKNLSAMDLYRVSHIPTGHETAFLMVTTGTKPVVLMPNYPELLRVKIPGCDIATVNVRTDSPFLTTFVFNRNASVEKIAQNREFFVRKLGLPSNSTAEDIYKFITSKQAAEQTLSNHPDIVGILLGYPRKSSIMYQLEAAGGAGPKYRGEPAKLRAYLTRVLHSPSSPYASFDAKAKKEIQAVIDSITEVKRSTAFGLPVDAFPFVCYGDESAAVTEIIRNIQKHLQIIRNLPT